VYYLFLITSVNMSKSMKILFYCYRVSQNEIPSILPATKNHMFTKQEPESSKCRSCLSGGNIKYFTLFEEMSLTLTFFHNCVMN